MRNIITLLIVIFGCLEGYSQIYSFKEKPFKYEYIHELKESPPGKFIYVATRKESGTIGIPSSTAMKTLDSVRIDKRNHYSIKFVEMPDNRSFYVLFRYRDNILREVGFQFVKSDKLLFYSKEPDIYGK